MNEQDPELRKIVIGCLLHVFFFLLGFGAVLFSFVFTVLFLRYLGD